MKMNTSKMWNFQNDASLLLPVLFLVGIGVVMVYSASSALSLKNFGTDYYFLKRQAVFALAGIVVLIACRHIPYPVYRSLAYPFFLAAFTLLLAVHISSWGFSAGGSTRWLRLGSLSFQPSEFARFALVIYLAYSMSKKREQVKDFAIGLVPHVITLGILAVPILIQPDFGSVVILAALTWLMLFVGGVRLRHLFLSVGALLPLLVVYLMTAEYRVRRLVSFLDPWQYPSDAGYQVVHSMMAFGTGGIWGTGIGKGYQKLFYLPEPHTDFVFSVIGEELGLLGVLIILGLYLILLWRGIQIAWQANDLFGSYLATGLTVALALQVSINMGVTLGLLPTKGLTLPFLSYGGSSLLMNLASIGVLLNIAAHAKQRRSGRSTAARGITGRN